MSELLKLAERCEAATGPDRELDFAIAEASGFERDGSMFWRGGDCFVIERDYYDIEGSAPELPSFTASIDAAMTLVPEGWALTLLETTEGDRRDHTGGPLPNWQACLIEHKNTGYRVDQRGCWQQGFAATPALALCAAALRALAAQEPSS